MKTKLLLAAVVVLSLNALGQTNSQIPLAVEPMEHTPTYRVTVVSRSIQAVNYKHRGGATKLDFAGTDLMPAANGQAKVESKKGYIEIEVEFGNLQKPTTFGNEYLTYILWAISPEGRAINLGEVLVGDNHRSKLDVTTDLQAFALIVTASLPDGRRHRPARTTRGSRPTGAPSSGPPRAGSGSECDRSGRSGTAPRPASWRPRAPCEGRTIRTAGSRGSRP